MLMGNHVEADRLYGELLTSVVNSSSDRFRILTAKGDNWYFAREFERAISPYESALNIDSDKAEARANLARSLLQARGKDTLSRLTRAIQLFEKNLQSFRDSPADLAETQNYLAYAY